MRERLRMVWAELEASPRAASGLVKRRLLADHPADLFAALRYPEGSRMLLLRLPLATARALAPRLVQMRGVRTDVGLDADDPSAGFVAISLVEPRLSDLFDVLVLDLAASLTPPMPDHQRGLTVVDRLEHWRELFATYRGEELSAEAQKGLYGELRWLEHLMESGAKADVAVGAWQGSPGGDHDFVCGAGAVEVKTSGAGQALAVASERQLDDSGLERLVLLHQVVTTAEAGQSLPAQVDAVRALVGPGSATAERFELRLSQVGYSDVHRKRYEEVGYVHEATHAYAVGDGFPRLTPTTVPPGVGGVRYTVDPAACRAFLIDPAAAAALFR